MYEHECRLDLGFTQLIVPSVLLTVLKIVFIYCVDILHMWEDTVINSSLSNKSISKSDIHSLQIAVSGKK